VNKKEIAQVLEEIAFLLELQGENPFKVRAYKNGARALLNLDEDLDKVIKEGRLTEIEGIGEHLAEKITQLATKGHLPYYENLRKSMPKGLLELIQIQGLGPKKVKALYKSLKLKSLVELKKAADKGKIAKLKGFGAKSEKNILEAIEHKERYAKRHLWWDAMETAAPILEGLKKVKGVKKAEIAGSLRRKLETVGDLDFLAAATDPKPAMQWFTTQPEIEKVLSKGETKSSVKLAGGIQADIRIVKAEEFPFALAYFTGSKEHNIKLRERALKKKLSLSEYGFDPPKKCASEEEIYKILGLCYIPPELRENQGEFEAAEKNKIPKLMEEIDIRGTFHNHTTASDGKSSLKEMIAYAEKLGWEYIGISDHSKSSFQANGQSEERLLKQIEEIHKINASKKFKPFVFAGVECDILSDGSLDFSEKILKKLGFVIASVHSSLTQDEKTMTKRIIKAIEHPCTTMLGHLSGRLLLRREPCAVNVHKVIDACIANKKIIELNGNPERLDMDWRLWHAASEKGLLCCINTDAHAAEHLDFILAGVNIARKGWLEKKHVINTRPLKEIKQLFLNL
jgi:DNA polymerase (family 10)